MRVSRDRGGPVAEIRWRPVFLLQHSAYPSTIARPQSNSRPTINAPIATAVATPRAAFDALITVACAAFYSTVTVSAVAITAASSSNIDTPAAATTAWVMMMG